MRQLLRDVPGFLIFVWRRWREDRCPQVAAALTYVTLLALVPVFVIGVAVLSSAPMFADEIEELKRFLLRTLVPDIARHIISVNLAQFQHNAARLTTLGLAGVLALALMLLLSIERTLNTIWRVRRTRPYWVSVLTYTLLVLVGPLLIGASLTMTTYLSPLVPPMIGLKPEPHSPYLRLLPFVDTILALFLIYWLLPHRRVPWRHALLGALVAGTLFESAKGIFSLYARMAPTYNVLYGAFAAVPFFLVWVYLSWLTILLGAELTAAAAYWEDDLWKHPSTPAMHFRHAVRVARALMHSGAPMDFAALRNATHMPVHEVEDALLRMEGAGIAKRLDRSRFELARPADRITVEQLYAATVVPIGAMDPSEWEEVSPEYAAASRHLRGMLQRPLSTLEGAQPAVTPPRKRRGGRGRSGRKAR
jgi:membrane protein